MVIIIFVIMWTDTCYTKNGIQYGSALLRNRWKMLSIDYSFASNKAKGPSLGNNLMTYGCFNCVIFRVKALGWLKKKEGKEMNNSRFQLFQVGHLRIVSRHS